MSQIEFYQTMMGRKFYEGHIPSLVDSLKRIADSLEKLSNPLVEMNTAGVKSGRFSSTISNQSNPPRDDVSDASFRLCEEVGKQLRDALKRSIFNGDLASLVHADAVQDAELTNGSGPYAQIMKILQSNGIEEGSKLIREILKEAVEA